MAQLKLLIFGVLMITGSALSAQTSDQDRLREAKVFFSHQRYAEALSLISNSRQLSRSNAEARFLMAICQYQTNKLDDAFRVLSELTETGKPPYPECWLYLAKVYHAQHRFREASDHYKIYLRSIFPNDPNRQMVIEEIRRCANGIELQFQASRAVAENLGSAVNTEDDEFAPISSPNFAGRLYFSSVRPQNTGGARDAGGRPDPQWGNYRSDLFQAQVVKGSWSDVTPMHFLLNSSKHEMLLGFGEDGQALYYFKGWDLQRGEIVVDTFRSVEERTLSSTPLPGPLLPEQGDNYPVFYRDTLIIFASNRPGGYGGWDLYKVSKRRGRWMLPENLGPVINTAYDETTPFLANDGQTLYFSSNDSRKSMGGLDVLKSHFIPQRNLWLPPENIGMPVNSAADDSFFKISRDGFTAFFASSRKDGYGKRDIYVALFPDFLPEMEFPADYFSRQNVPQEPAPASTPMISDKPAPAFEPANAADLNPTSAPSPRPATSGEVPVFEPNNRTDFSTVPASRPEPVATAGTEGPAPPDNIISEEERSLFRSIELSGKEIASGEYKRLDQIAEMLTRRRELRLLLTAAHPREGATGLALFRAIEKAEAVAQYLQDRGVAADQLFMRGLLAVPPENAVQQIELTFSGRDGGAPGPDLPVMGGEGRTGERGRPVDQALHYKIQVASAQRPLDEAYLEGQPEPMVEKTPDFPFYRYTLGAFTDRPAAERFRQRMKANGRRSAFLATYRQGWRIAR